MVARPSLQGQLARCGMRVSEARQRSVLSVDTCCDIGRNSRDACARSSAAVKACGRKRRPQARRALIHGGKMGEEESDRVGPLQRPGAARTFRPELELVLGMLVPNRHQVLTRYLDQRDERAAQFMHEASLPPDELSELLEPEGATDLLAKAFRSALETHLEEKRRALARAARSGLLSRDTAAIDDAHLLIQILDQMEAVHLRVLLAIASGDDSWPAPVEGRPSPAHGAIGGATHQTLVNQWPDQDGAVRAVTTSLEGLGLISNEGTFTASAGDGTWFVTQFGRGLLDMLGR